MYNHSDNYNALWTILSKDQIKFYATKDIKKGEEIFTSYGEGYWKIRNDLKK
jgi:SET domain-containing protein